MKEECLGCSHSEHPEGNNYCYMFQKAPEILPCMQHDKFAELRKCTGRLITDHPEILAMMIASISHA